MRVLIVRTDALGDVVISLSVHRRILERCPGAEVHWLVRPYAAPLLVGIPGVAGVHLREPGTGLRPLLRTLQPDAVLNLSHRDREILPAAKSEGVPLRVGRARGIRQILAATHRLWKGRRGTGRHEAQNALDFLRPFGWDGGEPPLPVLALGEAERQRGLRDLADIPRPRLGIVTRGSGSGAFPSAPWWDSAIGVLERAGWHPVILAPPEDSPLPPADLRSLLGRLAACDAVLGPSTGPMHAAAALDLPVLCLMGLRPHHVPSRWAPLGSKVETIQYPGPEADLEGGMDRLDPAELVPRLQRLCPASAAEPAP